MVDGVGGSSERCLKWGGGGWGVVKGSFQKHLKTGGGLRQKLFVGGGGFEGVTTPVAPENFNHTKGGHFDTRMKSLGTRTKAECF